MPNIDPCLLMPLEPRFHYFVVSLNTILDFPDNHFLFSLSHFCFLRNEIPCKATVTGLKK